MAAGQWWVSSTQGAELAQAYLTKWLRTVSQPLMRFRSVCDIKEAIGKHKGDTFNWDKIANIATAGAYTGLAETATVPNSHFTITKGTATVTEYANSITYTRKLLELSQHELKSLVRTSLANDMAKVIDRAIFAELAKTFLIYGPTSGTNTATIESSTNGTRATAHNATAPLSYKHIIQIVDDLKEKNVPAFDGEDYLCIAHPTTLQNLRTEMVSVNQYTETGYKKILSGEIGRFGGMRFVEQTNIAKAAGANAGAGNWAMFLGGEACIEAISVPEEIIVKEVSDFGRSLGLGWYLMAGWKLAWGDNATDAAANQCRVAMWWPVATSPADFNPATGATS